MTSPASDQLYYVRSGKKVLGPFDTEQLQELRAGGRLRATYEVSSDCENWRPVADVLDKPQPPAETGSTGTAPTGSWFYAYEGEQHGPITRIALRDLIAAGRLTANDLVWRDGMGEWTAIRDIADLREALPLPLSEAKLVRRAAAPGTRVGIGDAVIDFLADVFNESLLQLLARSLIAAGNWTLLILAVAAAGMSLKEALDHSEPVGFAMAAGILIGLTLLKTAGGSMATASQTLVDQSPSRLSSMAFPRAASLLILTGAMALSAWQMARVAGDRNLAAQGYLLAAGSLLLGGLLAVMLINSRWLRIELSRDVTIGEEGLGLLALTAKLLVRSSAVIYGVGALIAAIGYAFGSVMVLTTSSEISQNIGHGLQEVGLLIAVGTALAPILVYLLTSLVYIVIDALRAILSLSAHAAEDDESTPFNRETAT